MNKLSLNKLIDFLQTATPIPTVDLTQVTVMDNDADLFGVCFMGSLVAKHPQGGEVKSNFMLDLVLSPNGTKPTYLMFSDVVTFSSSQMSFTLEDGSAIELPIDEIPELLDINSIWDKFTPDENSEELKSQFLTEISNRLGGNISIDNIKSLDGFKEM